MLPIALAAILASISQPSPTGASAHAASEGFAAAVTGISRPRLVIVIAIDQLRADYLTRLSDLFLPAQRAAGPGGFRYLAERGAWYVNARYEHFPLFTGPGHAVIMTGAHPYKSGIISNDWWDRTSQHVVYCVDDARWKVVGAAPESKAKPVGPGKLAVSTLGDELKLATAGAAKVVSLALKDRAAILLGGHAQDVSIWFDTEGGRWISSTAFCRNGSLPAWVRALNDERIPDRTLGTQWSPSLSPEVLRARSIVPAMVGNDLPANMDPAFPHTVGSEATRANYRAFMFSPDANQFVFQTAMRAIEAEKLGADDVPDILAFNLSTNDYVGHCWGPYSPEAVDLAVRTDTQLADFLAGVAKAVTGGLDRVVVVLTADHGVSPLPEDVSSTTNDGAAGRFDAGAVLDAISSALTKRFGEPAEGSWLAIDPKKSGVVESFLDGFIYLQPDAVEKAVADGRASSVRDLESVACDAVNQAAIPGVYACYGRHQILEGRIPDTDLMHHLSLGVHPRLSSDLIVIPQPYWLQEPMSEGHATTHGTPYVYDTHVPILFYAPGIVEPGMYADRVAPSAIAPTLSLILGIEFPSGCDGHPLVHAISCPSGLPRESGPRPPAHPQP